MEITPSLVIGAISIAAVIGLLATILQSLRKYEEDSLMYRLISKHLAMLCIVMLDNGCLTEDTVKQMLSSSYHDYEQRIVDLFSYMVDVHSEAHRGK